jgi:RHH-type proline utilization regulon transcriptional repressor/proline dehydrogenase/delta 1-pyrroline-5-carboxylate dehydrogenase
MNNSPLSHALNQKITEFGTNVFRDLEDFELSPLEIRFWNARMMQWSMSRPDFKVNLFRLVDVLPTLTTPDAVADHVRQYLTEPANRIHPALGWIVGWSKSSLGAWLTHKAVTIGVQQMANLFIAGYTPEKALPVLRRLRGDGFCFTVDLLGEFCVCESEALEYQGRYLDALDTFGASILGCREGKPLIDEHPGESSPVCISVKLSALYSQTGSLNFFRSVETLTERLSEIARRAKKYGALVYVDAEDSGNNPIIYETFKRVFSSAEFRDFPYPGIVIQAYAKGATERVAEMLTFAEERGAPIAIRLVKGAYWDMERVISAQNHWDFPLFEEKRFSDASYEHLSRILLDNTHLFLPAFGSHNIRSLSHACCYAESKGLTPKDFEIQVLYGMAEPIAQAFSKRGYLTRMYVPLGELLPGMGYLVRRLLENTSNESFLRHTFFEHSEVHNLLKDPAVQDAAVSPQEDLLSAIEVPALSAIIPEGQHHATHEATVACNLEY